MDDRQNPSSKHQLMIAPWLFALALAATWGCAAPQNEPARVATSLHSAGLHRQFAWPVALGTVSSPFGMRRGVMHQGIDIAAPAGTPVRSADAGRVIFVGQLRGYGNVVIVDHGDGYATVYGHNRRNLVHFGDHVIRGQEMAEIGTSGRTDGGANLHFEVRHENHPQNPIAYLPPPEAGGEVSFARNSSD